MKAKYRKIFQSIWEDDNTQGKVEEGGTRASESQSPDRKMDDDRNHGSYEDTDDDHDSSSDQEVDDDGDGGTGKNVDPATADVEGKSDQAPPAHAPPSSPLVRGH